MNGIRHIGRTISLTNIFKRGYVPQRLHVYDQGKRNSMSGIRATVFGGTGFMGPYVGAMLGYIGSDVIFPHNHEYPFDDDCKELKLCANLGQSFLVRHMDFEDPKMIDRVIANSNVIVNLVGPRKRIKRREDFEYINIEIPKRIAAAAKKNPNILRVIHFSAVGASPNSPSLDLQTKYYGEQEVLEAFPNATIIRPSAVYGRDDYLTRLITMQKEFYYNFIVVHDDCTAKRQPIFVHDVALAVLNALKLDETCGKTYELGGPHTYSMMEIYEMVHNFIRKPTKLVHFPKPLALKLMQVLPNWDHFCLDHTIKHGIDLVCDPNARKIDELMVTPVSFAQGIERILHDHRIPDPTKDETIT